MNLHEFESISNSWKDLSVLVAGDVIIDKHIYCAPHKLSQEAPVQVLRQESTSIKPGGAANVAMMCAKMGASVSLFGRIDNGDEVEDETEELLWMLEDADICVEGLVHDSTYWTPLKTRIWAGIDQHYQQVLRIDDELPEPCRMSAQELRDCCKDCRNYKDADIVIISDYNKGFCTDAMFAALPLVGEEKGCRYADPPDRPDWIDIYSNRSGRPNYVVTNRKKAFGLASAGLAERLQSHVVTTKGGDGCDWATFTGQGAEVLTHRRQPLDVTGCGDQFLVAFALTQYAHGMDKACQVANLVAGLQAMRIGCQPVSVPEVMVELIERGEQ